MASVAGRIGRWATRTGGTSRGAARATRGVCS